ncbi:MAG: 4-carboxymuconolactone decarboxylase [Francisellaceae bacterium]|jgi:4-carboxymuconolactone decarboxylase
MDTKYEKGLELLNELHGGNTGEEIINKFSDICPKMAQMTIETIFGDLFQREILYLKTRELTIIASLTTQGSCLPQLEAHIQAAIKVSATKEEIAEVILQTAYFSGFPVAANAMICLKNVCSKIYMEN